MLGPYRSRVDFAVLGPLRVEGPNGPLEVRGNKERTLLAVLVANRGRTVPTASLVEALWEQAPPPSAQKSLQTFVLRVRKALVPGVLVTDGGGYRLAVPAAAVDAERFAELAAAGRVALEAGRYREAASRLSAGLALWRGPAYADFGFTAFGQAQARRLEEMRLTAVEDLWAAELALGGSNTVVPEVERLVQEHPYRERLWALLVRALYRQGRQGDALGAFDRARRILADELGVEPGRELRELQAQVLAHDPRLDPTIPTGLLPPFLVRDGPLVDRDAELRRLEDLRRRARQGEAITAVVRGPSGAARAGWSKRSPPGQRRKATMSRWPAMTGQPMRHWWWPIMSRRRPRN